MEKKISYYFAPMEGITGYLYRNAFAKYFGGIDKYFTPFISPTQNHLFTARELNDVRPENNQGIHVVPQLLTANADDFIWAAKELQGMGYREINFNLGCPSNTVAAKKKGSGFLLYPRALDEFLDRVFAAAEVRISIKTRIGKNSADEFEEIMDIYRKYPLKELIIHPRIQKQFYRGQPHWEVVEKAAKTVDYPVCYNGDLFSLQTTRQFLTEYPEIHRVMIGRGLLANPFFFAGGVSRDKLAAFHRELTHNYQVALSGDKPVLFKMKELWFYLSCLFLDRDGCRKKIRKCQTIKDFAAVAEEIFSRGEFAENPCDFCGRE